MKPLAIYTRTSTKGDADDNRRQSHAEQRDRVRRYAEAHGLAVLDEEFKDDHKSGGQMDDRPELWHAVDLVADGKAGGIVVAFLDRLSRSSEQGQKFIRELGHVNPEAVVVAIDLNLTITPRMSAVDKFMFQNLLSTAEYVRNALGERIESAKQRAVDAGVLVGPAPVGLRLVGNPAKDRDQWNDEERQVIVDPDTAPFIRELFERCARGAGYGELAAWLDSTGVVPWRIIQRAKEKNEPVPTYRWSRQGVAAILRNEVYVTGTLPYGKGTDGTPRAIQVWGASDEPIVDRGTFRLAQRRIAERRVTGARERANPNSRWLATGLLKCLYCEHNLSPTTGSKKQGGTRRYRCVNRDCPGREKGARVSVDAGYIERVVVAKALELGDNLVATAAEEVDFAALDEELDRERALLDDLTSPEALQSFGRERWLTMGAEQRRKVEELEAERKRLSIEAGMPEGGKPTNLGHLWHDLAPAQQREAIAWYIEAVLVGKPSARGRGRGRAPALQPEYVEGDIIFRTRHRPWRLVMEVELTTVTEEVR